MGDGGVGSLGLVLGVGEGRTWSGSSHRMACLHPIVLDGHPSCHKAVKKFVWGIGMRARGEASWTGGRALFRGVCGELCSLLATEEYSRAAWTDWHGMLGLGEKHIRPGWRLGCYMDIA